MGFCVPPHISIGTIFQDRYEIKDRIGAGGVGQVYEAAQIATGQRVAVKVLTASTDLDPERRARAIARFDREMRLCAQLHHPHIVRLIDSGRAGDLFYTVFEYVPGRTLADVLDEDGALDPVEAGRLMGQVLDALAAAHAAGVVHRDLKPQNIMITASGARRNATVLDFGIGAMIEDTDDVRLTRTGEWVGTPAYASPEQVRGEPPTQATDLFAWGLVFCECLTGERVVDGATVHEMMMALLSPAPVALPVMLAEHPAGALLGDVLDKDATRRTITAAEALARLDLTSMAALGVGFTADDGRFAADITPRAATAGSLTRSRMGERRQVTVLACRLHTIGGHADDLEGIDDALRDVKARCAAAANRFGGRLGTVSSDRVLLYFGLPAAREDDARRAARAARSLVDEVAAIAVDATGVRPQVGCGVHTGLVVVRPDDALTAGTLGALGGPTPDGAIRRADLAGPGEIGVSAETRGVLRRDFGFDSVGDGFRLRREVDASADTAISSTSREAAAPMFGREAELTRARERWQRACEGDGQIIFVTGEAGIGKSRLLIALAEAARSVGALAIECRCSADSQHAALRPVVDVFERFIVGEPNARPGALAAFLERHGLEPEIAVPLWAPLLAVDIGDAYPPSDLPPAKQKDVLLGQIVAVLLDLAGGRPLFFAIEDLHWADPTTLELVSRLVAAIGGASCCAVLTARPDFEPAWPMAGGLHLPLGRLGRDHVAEMVDAACGGRTVPDTVVEAIWRRADGVALFVEELVRVMIETGHLVDPDGGGERYALVGTLDAVEVPTTLRDLLMARLDRTGAAKATAQLAAALGERFEPELLRAASDRGEHELDRHLEALEAADLIRWRWGRHKTTIVFRHALVRDTAYASMLAPRRREVHAAIVHAIESRFPVLTRERPDLLARHHAAADHTREAIRYARRAGMSALMRSLNHEAIAHIQEALGWLDGFDEGPERVMAELGLNGILTPALMAAQGYTSPALRTSTRRSVELLDEVEASPHNIPTLFALSAYYHVLSERAQARQMAERFVDHTEKVAPDQVIAALPVLAQCRWIEGDFAGARALLERALPMYDARSHGGLAFAYGIDALAYTRMTLAPVLWAQGELNAALVHANGAAEHARAIKHGNTLGMALLYLASLHHYRGDKVATGQTVAELGEVCAKYGLFYDKSFGGLLGCWAGGDTEIAPQILAFHEQGQVCVGMSYYRGTYAQSLFDAGRLDEAAAELERCLDHAHSRGERYYLPVLHTLVGRVARARDGHVHPGGAAETAFRTAMAEAVALGAPTLELEAAVELARDRRDSADVRARLTSVIERFGADEDAPVLREARDMIGD